MVEDKRDLLKTPLHGVYIPIGLIVLGTCIFDWRYLPYTLSMVAAICGVQFYYAFARRNLLHKLKWNDLELMDKTIVLKNSAIYRFKLNRDEEILDIPTGHHVAACFDIDGKDEIRYYTPILNKFDSGFFDILVKSYPEGKVSKKFAFLKEGQTVKFRGPVGRLEYQTNMAKEIGLIAGGSGITPILQVITEIITTPEDTTKISLIFANETEADILLKSEIDELADKYPNLSVFYTLTYPPPGWTGGKGYVTKEMISEHLPLPLPDNRIFVCGPPQMKKTMIEYTHELGWEKTVMQLPPHDQVFCF